MATLTLHANFNSAICINGNFLGFIEESKPLTLPLPASDTFFTAVSCESGCKVLNYFLSFKDGIRLLPCSGRLCRWADDLYELFFVFEKEAVPPPPVILKEERWGNETVGLCGGYFLKEGARGCNYFPERIDDYELCGDHAILKQKRTVIIIDKDLKESLRRENCSYIRDSKNIILRFTPGEMDFFTVEQVFNDSVISSKIIQAQCNTVLDRLRCFCQAVRLDCNVDDFITPSLKSQMSIEDIKSFLGIFDQTDSCRYLSTQDDNAIALRYMVDQCNFHYLSFRFTLVNGLIDDICEL